ncbi:SRPBCC domain-containing protein [Luteolibacter algae]|uniref:SRPBCC domain-containing protein n=1 Tax=Luteolibacter algae TaxID=454151 RepID=A0ABW5D453_9BACT
MNEPFTFRNSRVLSATPEQIHRAFQNRDILAGWWGPEGFSSVIHEFDFSPRGILKMDMRGPDGTIYPNIYRFESIGRERIVFVHPEAPHSFTAEILLEPLDGKTKLTRSQTFDDPDEFEKVSSFIPACNEQLLDRLSLQLACHFPGELDLVFSRIIDAPAEKVFRAWTDPEMIVKWFTPPPWKTVSAELDVRPGGRMFLMMQGPDGVLMPNAGVYLEVVPSRRLVSTDAYTEGWIPSPKPFVTIDLNFEDLGGQTKYIAIARHWTKEDLETHRKMGFHTGWSTATDQLETLIK